MIAYKERIMSLGETSKNVYEERVSKDELEKENKKIKQLHDKIKELKQDRKELIT